jgi:hypothetical protein
MTTRYYRDRGLQDWVEATCQSERIDAGLAFSSAMAQYFRPPSPVPMLIDFVDVDSEKWNQYSNALTWPLSWLYRRESSLLLAFERASAARAERSFFVTKSETALFQRLAPECSSRVETLCNGVDSSYFRARSGPSLALRHRDMCGRSGCPGAGLHRRNGLLAQYRRGHLVRASRDAALERASSEGALLHCRTQPLQIAAVAGVGRRRRDRHDRGRQTVPAARNRRGRAYAHCAGRTEQGSRSHVDGTAVVASAACAEGIDARPGVELVTAATPGEFVRQIESLLRAPDQAALMGDSARRCVLRNYSWEANLARLDSVLAALPSVELAA